MQILHLCQSSRYGYQTRSTCYICSVVHSSMAINTNCCSSINPHLPIMSPSVASPCSELTTETCEPLVTSKLSDSGKVCIVTLNRPKALNAISRDVASQLFKALKAADDSPSIRVAIITGCGRAFSAGADIKELRQVTSESAFQEDWLADWNNQVGSFRKPLIAAVNGFALGGGMELAMMCDIIHCSRSATFGLPEIKLGTIPGAGGTQRLLASVGKSRAFEMILSGDRMGSEEALKHGLVSRVFDDEHLIDSCVKFAEKVACMSTTALKIAKEAVNVTQRSIYEGIHRERHLYHLSFGTSCFQEGVSAFFEKRDPKF